MYVGRAPDQPPTENTLEVNITHEILQQIREVFKKAVAVNPTRGEENDFGYDISVDWDWLKIFALQFKTFDNKGAIRLNGYHTKREYYKYELNKKQHKQLMYHFPLPSMAFYTLPVFPQRKDLDPPLLDLELIYLDISEDKYKIIELPRVIFIDVHTIPADATKISISTDSNNANRAVCYCKDRKHHTIDYKNVFSWQEIWDGLLSCQMGAKLREDGEPTQDVYNIMNHRDQPIEDQRSADKLQSIIQISLGKHDLPEKASGWESDDE